MALEAIGARATLVPLRLSTEFHGENGVRDLLHREAERLTAALAHLSGRREWGVKAFAAEAPPEAAAEPSSGSGYLRQRQHERDRRTRRAETVAGACEAIHDQLAELADDARSNPPQRPEVSGGPHPMVLNGAYLVADDGFEEFLERSEALRAQYAELGLELELTGPWPAYNFIPDAIGVA
jgi:hypothetical protein